jgi:hypothetical protein
MEAEYLELADEKVKSVSSDANQLIRRCDG